VLDLWGPEGVERVAERLPLATRVATIDGIVLPFEWVGLDHVVAWHDAIWSGAARGDERELARLVARSIELGFGRFKSAFFAGITPARLVDRAQELWRYQHTHGEVEITVEGQRGTVVLKNHPYVEHASSRRVTAESYRHIVTMTGATDVTAAWGVAAGAGSTTGSSAPTAAAATAAQSVLVVQLLWRA
jgi:hypothetical protein